MKCLRWVTPVLPAGLFATALAACKHDAQVYGTLSQAGKGVPGAMVSLTCANGSNHLTTTNATGDFRFEELGPGVDDACMVEIKGSATWVAPLSIGTRCAQHDATGLCTEALFAFQVQ